MEELCCMGNDMLIQHSSSKLCLEIGTIGVLELIKDDQVGIPLRERSQEILIF